MGEYKTLKKMSKNKCTNFFSQVMLITQFRNHKNVVNNENAETRTVAIFA